MSRGRSERVVREPQLRMQPTTPRVVSCRCAGVRRRPASTSSHALVRVIIDDTVRRRDGFGRYSPSDHEPLEGVWGPGRCQGPGTAPSSTGGAASPRGTIRLVASSERRGERHEAFVATTAALRQRVATLALGVARVEEELAVTLDRLAERDVGRADELHGRAAAARRYAEIERETARRFGNG